MAATLPISRVVMTTYNCSTSNSVITLPIISLFTKLDIPIKHSNVVRILTGCSVVKMGALASICTSNRTNMYDAVLIEQVHAPFMIVRLRRST